MSQTKQRFVVEDSGRIVRETITEQEIDVKAELMAKFAADQTFHHRNLFNGGVISPKLTGNIHMSNRGKQVAFTVELAVLPLRARFMVSEADKCLVPDFTSKSTPMALEWAPPPGMKLYLLISMVPDACNSDIMFLIAVDAQKRTYRLPTSNCYDNCKLCTGKYNGSGSSYADSIGKALNQFVQSDWQSDLVDRGGSNGMLHSQQMFRFKPLEPEGFEQLPPKANWPTLCTKVADPFISTHLVL